MKEVRTKIREEIVLSEIEEQAVGAEKNEMFTIEVRKKEKDEKFSFEDLKKQAKVSHNSCYNGEAVWVDKREGWGAPITEWHFICQRCGAFGFINSPFPRTEIINTAIDGKKRNLGGSGVQVVRKT